jgi:Predicted phosphatases
LPFLQNSDNPSSGRKDQPPHYQFILFDLDGTLLPMDQDRFTEAYFRALCRRIYPYGYTPEALTEGVWKGTAAMVENDGRKPNREVFWDAFSAVMGEEIRQLEDTLDSFYRSEFSSLKQ